MARSSFPSYSQLLRQPHARHATVDTIQLWLLSLSSLLLLPSVPISSCLIAAATTWCRLPSSSLSFLLAGRHLPPLSLPALLDGVAVTLGLHPRRAQLLVAEQKQGIWDLTMVWRWAALLAVCAADSLHAALFFNPAGNAQRSRRGRHLGSSYDLALG